MKQFFSVADVTDLPGIVDEALKLKKDPFAYEQLGKRKMLGLVFLNPSLRTRLSTQKAAINLGMDVMVMNMDKDGWALETRDGVAMDGNTVEHIREAAAVMGQYCDILGMRSFPKLQDREEDYNEDMFRKFIAYSNVPVVSLESATRHPLQSLTDLITIREHWQESRKPKVVLAWAPHVKALPQAVPNSFAEWMCKAQAAGMVDFTIAQPKGYELADEFTRGAMVTHRLDDALDGADFVYVKNWSSFADYGKVLPVDEPWTIDNKRLAATNRAKVMHCLPVRRDVELAAEVLNGPQALVIPEAGNRVWAAQVVLKRMLEQLA
jgi:Ornithine carbamoyltransferase